MASASSLETRVSPSLSVYAKNTATLADSAIRISTGNRILRIGDDASNLTSSLRLATQTSTLRSTLVSGARASSFLQVATTGLTQIRDILGTLADLTTQANASGRTGLSYATLDAQFQSSLAQIDGVVAATTFNGASLLDGSAASGTDPYTQIGATHGDSVSLAIPDVSTTALFTSPPTLHNAAAATAATSAVASASEAVDDAIALVEAYQQRLIVADAAAQREIAGVSEGFRNLVATDTPAETHQSDSLRLRQNTAAALLAQTFGIRSDLLGLLANAR